MNLSPERCINEINILQEGAGKYIRKNVRNEFCALSPIREKKGPHNMAWPLMFTINIYPLLNTMETTVMSSPPILIVNP